VGRELSSFATQLEHASDAVRASLPRVRDIPIGGTAVGSGLNAPAGWDGAMCEVLSALTGTSFTPAADKLACQAAHDAFVNHHGTLKTLACALVKLANDIRWLASGPRAGLGELRLPANEPGSSIMPGKVNPTQCEAMLMVCARVFGNDATMTFAGASGELQLNVYKPLIAQCCLESLGLLSDAIRSMTERLVAGLEVNEQRLASQVERSLMLVTALAPRIGYERAAELAQRALRDDKTLRDVVLDGTDMSAQELDALIRSMAV
jgi:fumarate hydratase class II